MKIRLCIYALCVSFLLFAPFAAAAEKAKNVILLIGDGMGFNSDLAGTYYRYGEAGKQRYHAFPVRLGCTTFSQAKKDAAIPPGTKGYDPAVFWETIANGTRGTEFTVTTDSAAASTALHGGLKTVNRQIGMDADMKPIRLISEIAVEQGKKAGSVTSVPVSHATPAGFSTHADSRNDYGAIFLQMTGKESPLSVAMGAGHPLYNNGRPLGIEKDEAKQKRRFEWVGGEATWETLKSGDLNGFAFIETKERFGDLVSKPLAGKVVGLARSLGSVPPVDGCLDDMESTKTLLQSSYKNTDWDTLPSLSTMALGAIDVLSRDNPNGFLLLIEGGAIDGANHAKNAKRSVLEHTGFSKAVDAVIDWVEKNSSWDETLVIVTADHETGQIWGPDTYSDDNENGVFDEGDRFEAFMPVENKGRGNVPGVQYGSGGHSNALVPLWAKGPGAALFLDRVKGVDEEAGKFWNFSGKYVDNTDVAEVIKSAMTP